MISEQRMPSVFIKTYGCQMNERDSEAVAAQLVAKGYSMTADALKADVILLNTCSVRDAAEQKALGKMSHVAGQLRSKNRKAVLLAVMMSIVMMNTMTNSVTGAGDILSTRCSRNSES